MLCLVFQLSLMANFSLHYLEASLLQIEALKNRSTYCTQEVQIDCRRFSLSYNGGRKLPLSGSLALRVMMVT